MPSYKIHAAGAIIGQAVLLAALAGTGIWCCSSMHALWIVLWAILGGLFPDVDTKSKIQRPFYMVFCALLVWLISFGNRDTALALALLGYTPLLVHHRGLFHAWWLYAGCALLTVIWWSQGHYTSGSQEIWLYTALLAWAWGAIIHVMLDRV